MTKPLDPASLARGGSEHGEQCALFAWAALEAANRPELRLMFAIPNGGKRNKSTAAMLKAEGVKAGTPDIFLPVARSVYHGLFIELKKTGGNPSDEQLETLDRLNAQGYCTAVCVGWERARDLILWYLSLTRLP